jgi:parallel beta-helix repeat protein
VRHGTGTVQDPFVIQNITISRGKGLSISNTDAYAVVSNVTIENLADGGVFVRNSKNLLFEDLTIRNASTGLYVEHSQNCSFVRCDIDVIRMGQSVSIYNSGNCTLSNSRVSNSTDSNLEGSVVLANSVGCGLVGNEIVDCDQGIFITASESCAVIGNIVPDSFSAILIDSSLNMTISLNDLGTNSISLQGSELRHFSTHTITEDNTVNGLPVLYVNGVSGVDVQNVSIGQLIAVNCSDFSIRNLSFDEGSHECIYLVYCNRGIVENIQVSGGTLDWYSPYYYGVATRLCENISVTSCTISNVSAGIGLNGRNLQASWNILTNSEYGITCGESNLTISNNTMFHDRYGISVSGGILGTTNCVSILRNNISDGQIGIKVSEASNTTIRLNKILDNHWGILLEGYYFHAGNILVCQNDFIQNTVQATVYGGNVSAVWDAGYPAGGNYWSDYSGTDNAQGETQTSPGSDGIGDSPYQVFVGQLVFGDLDFWDEYPLMNPFTT